MLHDRDMLHASMVHARIVPLVLPSVSVLRSLMVIVIMATSRLTILRPRVITMPTYSMSPTFMRRLLSPLILRAQLLWLLSPLILRN